MPRATQREGFPWPKCKACKSVNTTGTGAPPEKCFAECLECGEKWQVCGAAKNRKICGRQPMENGRCYFDGGKATGAPIKHGLRSKHLKGVKRLGKMFEAALNDQEIVSAKENIALFESLIQEQIGKLKDDSPENWARAYELFREAKKGGPDGAIAFNSLGTLLEDGAEQDRARERIAELMELQGKQKEREDKRESRLLANWNARQAIVFAARLLQAVEEEAKDRGTQIRIASRFNDIMLSEGLPGIDGAADGPRSLLGNNPL